MTTTQDIKSWLQEEETVDYGNGDEVTETREYHIFRQTKPSIPSYIWEVMFDSPQGKDVMRAGGWLLRRLREKGELPDEEISAIGFLHGRMSFGRDPYLAAIKLFNQHY